MPRPHWKGYLKLSLVTCPVAMVAATRESEKIRFHTINRKTGKRIRSQYVDAVTGKAVEEHDEVKGYPRGEDDFILIEDEELEAVGLESVRTVDIDVFVPAESIDWIWYEKPYYLMPDDPVGEERLKPWGPEMVHDPVQERLKEIIASKKKRRPPKRPAREASPEPPAPNVVSIMDALRRSVAAEHRPAKKGSAIPKKGGRKASSPRRSDRRDRPGKRG